MASTIRRLLVLIVAPFAYRPSLDDLPRIVVEESRKKAAPENIAGDARRAPARQTHLERKSWAQGARTPRRPRSFNQSGKRARRGR